MEPPMVSSRVFKAVQAVDVEALSSYPDPELRPVLASLVRMSLIASLDKSSACYEGRTAVLRILSRVELVNQLVALLSIEFHSLETDVKKEMALRSKLGVTGSNESVLISNLSHSPALEFERYEAERRLRLVLSELLAIMGQLQKNKEEGSSSATSSTSTTFTTKTSELFDQIVYLSEVCDVLAIAMAELPNLLSPPEVAEALLRLKFGPEIICHMVANQPDSFNEVVNHLLRNGDKQDDNTSTNNLRHKALLLLCRMQPSQTLYVRNKCIELTKMPSLAVALTLEHCSKHINVNVVSFMTGLLLGADPQLRSWISYYIRNGQKKQNETLAAFRAKLLEQLKGLVQEAKMYQQRDGAICQHVAVRASAMLRLYTALKGIAGLKLADDEVAALLEMITCKPPVTAAGVKFASLGLSVLIACNSLITNPENERSAVEWIQWLVQEESHFERATGFTASFGEMLLLMAIHFHSNQMSAIADLVCQTLGMKIAIRINSMHRIKQVFTQEIFTDQVVAYHAIRVPVTPNLSSKMSGFLPVHCIHQLLKCRAFSKHKVPIKEWIYKQICESAPPLHPVLPSLLEVFVNSALVPTSNRGSPEMTVNEPISEHEIRAVFQNPVFELPQKISGQTPIRGHRSAGNSAPRSRESTPAFKMSSSAISTPSALKEKGNLSAQMLMLYYVLYYESVRLSHMKSILMSGRKVVRYSHDLLSELPIKFLLQTAERDQERFGGIYPQLLRLCSTHFPHLCMVQDTLMSDSLDSSEDSIESCFASQRLSTRGVTIAQVKEALSNQKSCPAKLILVMKRLLQMPAPDVWQFSDLLVSHVKQFMEPGSPQLVRELFGQLWFHLNGVFPRKLWTLTINHLNHVVNGHVTVRTMKKINHDDLIIDPLQILRCDRRVFQCAPILKILLYILKACLAASRTMLTQHLQENPIIERTPSSQVTNDLEREELKNALIAAQESAAVQILLEAGLSGAEDHVKEVKLICSYLHETFINDPNLAKLVHFQGYPTKLLPITVKGVPSMHICMDFAPELLRQPDLDKQAFAVDLVSHLSVQYALPKSFSTARLAVNVLSTLLSVLTSEERQQLFPQVLPAFVRFCKAFPPLIEDVVGLLLQYGRIVASQRSLRPLTVPDGVASSSLGAAAANLNTTTTADSNGISTSPRHTTDLSNGFGSTEHLSMSDDTFKQIMKNNLEKMPLEAQETFEAILRNSVLEKRLY